MASISSPPSATPVGVPPSIRRKLRGLRRSVRSWLLAYGLSRILLILLAVVLVDLAIDWMFRMDRVQRIWVLVMSSALIAWLVYRRILGPVFSRLDDEALSMRVESSHPELAQSLISAVQLGQRRLTEEQAAALGISPGMIGATIEEGCTRSERIDFRDALDDFEFRRSVMLLFIGVVMFGALIFAVAKTSAMQIWFDRNVLLGESQWPQKTYLRVKGVGEDGTLALPRGDDWLQVIDVAGQVPSLVYLEYEPESGRRSTEQLKQVGEASFHATFKNMLDEFRFRAYGGDSTTPWVQVRLVDRPALEDLQLTLEPPKYTGEKVSVLPAGAGPYQALRGSTLHIKATANKPLSRARLKWNEQVRDLAVSGRELATIITPDLLTDGTFSLDLVDADSLESKRPIKFTITTRTDCEPTVRARLEGISGMIIPGARVPVAMTVQDDFAVTSVALRYNWQPEGSEGGGSADAIVLAELSSNYGQPKIAHQYPFDTTPLGLQTGANLSFHMEAVDNDTVSAPEGQPGKSGQSDNFVLRVVTEEELRADLLRREKERRVDIERLLKDQEELQTESRAILATVQGVETPVDQRSLLTKVQRRQQITADRIASVARQLSQLALEVENNRLEEESGPVQQRLHKQIIAPLDQIARDAIPQAARQLDDARRITSDLALRDSNLQGAVDQQQKIIRDLRSVLRHMAKSEGYQEAINLLYAILKSQGEVNQLTVKEAQQRIRDIFSEENKSSSGAN